MKIRTLLFLSLMFSLTSAFAIDLKEGSYRGKSTNDKKNIELFVKDYPGRDGSFIAIIIKDNSTGFAYLVDKFSDGKYGMTPLKTLSNAVIGLEDANPALALTIVNERKKTIIKINSNNSNNKLGLMDNIRIIFKDADRRSSLVHTMPGTFKYKGERSSATLSNQSTSNESALTLSLPKIAGEFVLREVRPFLHILLKSSMSNTGEEVANNSSMMAFFIEGGCLFGFGDYMVLMESNTGKLTYLKQR